MIYNSYSKTFPQIALQKRENWFEVSFVAPYALGVFFAFLWLDKMTFDGL